MVEWADGQFSGANVHVIDGDVSYWATVPADWSDADVVDAFCLGYDTDIGRDEGGCWEGMTHAQAIASLRESVDVERTEVSR